MFFWEFDVVREDTHGHRCDDTVVVQTVGCTPGSYSSACRMAWEISGVVSVDEDAVIVTDVRTGESWTY